MKSKKVKKILLIALTCVAISASVSAEAAMKSQIRKIHMHTITVR